MPPAAPTQAQITVLYDAFGKSSGMQKDWGYAALIEYGGKRILFDTGNNPDILAHNAQVKGIDLSKLDFVVMSHRHGDHMGGLSYVLKVNPAVKIYAPKEDFGVMERTFPVRSIERMPPCLLSSVTTMALRRTSCDSGRLGPGRTFNSSTETPKSLLTFTSLRWCRTSRERLNCVSCH
jgi:metal-dependent hydrolase (beta-lactamase superfamily II)